MNDDSAAADRRPIASRNLPLAIRLADRLARAGVSPNAISVGGMLAGVAAGAAFACTGSAAGGRWCFALAAGLMVVRLVANMLDGMVAIEAGKSSPVGQLYNEVPDRVSDSGIFIGAGYAAGSVPELGYLAALAAMFTAYVRAQGRAAGGAQEFCGPLAKPQRMAVLGAAALGAAVAPAPSLDAATAWLGAGPIAVALWIITVGSVVTAARRLARSARTLRATASP